MRFQDKVSALQSGPLRAVSVSTLQINLGYVCNMTCSHCHVDAGPLRSEAMKRETAEMVLSVLRDTTISILDITGGAPELNPNFMFLVEESRRLGRQVIIRSNLTVLADPRYEYLFDLFGRHDLEITGSLPCYTEGNVDSMRGKGAFRRSVQVLKRLNAIGYGTGNSAKRLHLAYNPGGAFLPASQAQLEGDYKRVLMEEHGISFDHLFMFANVAVGRFSKVLEEAGKEEQYHDLLKCSFNANALPGLMCRYMISVGWDGRLYDCDFNQVLDIPLDETCPQHVRTFDLGALSGRAIAVGDHCFACTAGKGFT
ncbi:MAG: arsenosugar biosynthesis radical SAM protein ArsS [Nitrospirae bacterium]|nr:arsenosugar biosynthesis radical SAM protein ArsS [Nitrospirota bacterium]